MDAFHKAGFDLPRNQFRRGVLCATPYYIVTTKTLPARVILEWRTAALQILRYARE